MMRVLDDKQRIAILEDSLYKAAHAFELARDSFIEVGVPVMAYAMDIAELGTLLVLDAQVTPELVGWPRDLVAARIEELGKKLGYAEPSKH